MLAVLYLDRLPTWFRVARSLNPKRWSTLYVVDPTAPSDGLLREDDA